MTGRETKQQVMEARDKALPFWEAEPPSKDIYGMLDAIHDFICAADALDGCVLLTAEEAGFARMMVAALTDDLPPLPERDEEPLHRLCALLTPQPKEET